jgi:hypothetical protein
MPFPLRFADRVLDGPPALAATAIEDAKNGGGTVVPGVPTSQWVIDLVARGALEREIAVSLAAMMLGGSQGGAVAEGARLAARLRHPQLDALVGTAVMGQDIGVMLEPDPARPGRSTEDALLAAWAEIAPLDDANVRAALLERLRNAGLNDLELQVLAVWGTPAEIRQWMPSVFIEGVPRGASGAVTIGTVRGGEVAAAIRAVVADLPPAVRAVVE